MLHNTYQIDKKINSWSNSLWSFYDRNVNDLVMIFPTNSHMHHTPFLNIANSDRIPTRASYNF